MSLFLFLLTFCPCARALWKEIGDSVLSVSGALPDMLNPLSLVYTNRCTEDLGCFYTGPPFYHPTNRPISLPPTSDPEVKFLLFTRSKPEKEYLLEPTKASLKNSTFNPRHPTKCLIHGFLSDLDFDDTRFGIKNALLKKGDYNVIVVDWTAINGPPYSQAVANTRVTGAKLAKLVNFLINATSLSAGQVHLIGHSLGSHVAGYAGERIPGLGRITGLDPAGPYFYETEPEVRLDISDAHFVDVIHTDGAENIVGGLGISSPIGHMDFFPNGGRRQRGCTYTSSSDGVIGAAINMSTTLLDGGCDHERANLFFQDSVVTCRFPAVQCSSYEKFEAGDCQNSSIAFMGLQADPKAVQDLPAKFYLRTKGQSPFCDPKSVHL